MDSSAFILLSFRSNEYKELPLVFLFLELNNMKYTDEELIYELKIFSEYLGRIPTAKELKKDELMPSLSTYERRFNSWDKALEASGLLSSRQKYSEESIINSLINLKNKLGRMPKVEDLGIKNDTISITPIKRVFGTFNNALINAGFINKTKELLNNKEWLIKENKTKTLVEIGEDLGVHYTTISRAFSKYNLNIVKHNKSVKEEKWLDSLGITERQYPIENYKVDGYDPETNTVYEFLGDYWHGNPEVFKFNDYNANNGKTFGQLFEETQQRLNRIKSLGYNVVIQWENTFEC